MSRSNILDSQVQAFREALALWKPEDTQEAMACRDLEDLLRVGVFLYEQIDAMDRQWRLELARGAKYDKAKENAIESQFAWWLLPCPPIVRRIAHFTGKGFKVENADKFRRYNKLAKQALKEREAAVE